MRIFFHEKRSQKGQFVPAAAGLVSGPHNDQKGSGVVKDFSFTLSFIMRCFLKSI